ncbi:MAG: tRNA adenosine(34) deaminase TadA [Endozoicomonadaceae bacterium]|nr:tRNA adenosine(34) deaminase TadA [Endozoicomonadaceae bacterium]
MHIAFRLAQKAQDIEEIPIGAVIVYQDQIIGFGFNQSIQLNDPTAHAEIQAIRQAGEYLQNYRLMNCTLFVTVEPCAMCAGAIVHSRIKNIIFGAKEPKCGAVCSQQQYFDSPYLNHKVDWLDGVMAEESRDLMQGFFKNRRKYR